ncbi:MtaA/CmuA family methyltransferase [bacterium]|nr:MtaA/CmuA family methyltransferase [bacterium]
MFLMKTVISALLKERKEFYPCLSANPTPTFEQMNAVGVYFPEAHKDPEKMATLAMAGHKLVGFDAVRIPFCQTIEAEAFGCEVFLPGDNIPVVVSHPYVIGNVPKFPEDFLQKGRIPVLLEAIKIIKNELKEVPLIVGIVGPFSITGSLVGLTNLLMQMASSPDDIHPYMEIATEGAKRLAKAVEEAGADIICVEDMAASTDIISPMMYKDFVFPYHRELLSSISLPSILHICGNATPIVEYMTQTGADALSIDDKTDLLKIKGLTQGRTALIGNINPSQVLLQGDEERVREATRKAIREGIDIVAPGCAIPLKAPLSNLKSMVDEAHKAKPTRMERRSLINVYPFKLYGVVEKEKERIGIAEASPFPEIREAVLKGNKEECKRATMEALLRASPEEVMENGLVKAMEEVGKLWEEGYYFLPQVMLSADALMEGLKLCEEKMGGKLKRKGKVVLFVAKGDIHTIGKNIVKALLSAAGFEVIDLGVDVDDEEVIKAVKLHKPILLGGSALMTTTMSAFPRIAQKLVDEGIEVPFACGGGAVNEEFCDTFPLGIYGGEARRAPMIAEAALSGKSWREIRQMFKHSG